MSDLCTLADVHAFLRKQDLATADDPVLQMMITAASDEITRYASREFVDMGTLTRRFNVTPARNAGDAARITFLTEDLRSIDHITLGPDDAAPTELTTSAYALSAEDRRLPGTYSSVLIAASQSLFDVQTWQSFGYAQIDITGSWGAAAIPAIVNQAAYVTVAEWYRSKVTAFSTRFTEDGVHVAPAPLPTMVCGWLDRFERYQA